MCVSRVLGWKPAHMWDGYLQTCVGAGCWEGWHPGIPHWPERGGGVWGHYLPRRAAGPVHAAGQRQQCAARFPPGKCDWEVRAMQRLLLGPPPGRLRPARTPCRATLCTRPWVREWRLACTRGGLCYVSEGRALRIRTRKGALSLGGELCCGEQLCVQRMEAGPAAELRTQRMEAGPAGWAAADLSSASSAALLLCQWLVARRWCPMPCVRARASPFPPFPARKLMRLGMVGLQRRSASLASHMSVQPPPAPPGASLDACSLLRSPLSLQLAQLHPLLHAA